MATDPGPTPNPKPAKGIDERLARQAAKSAERLARKVYNPQLRPGSKAAQPDGRCRRTESAVGTVAGVSAARALRHKEYIEDAYSGEDFALLEADRGCVITTGRGAAGGPRGRPGDRAADGGVRARILPADGSFHFQRAALAEQWGEQVRMVFYDQRGHGQSGAAPVRTYGEPARPGPGNRSAGDGSARPGDPGRAFMGGMTVLSHARQLAGSTANASSVRR